MLAPSGERPTSSVQAEGLGSLQPKGIWTPLQPPAPPCCPHPQPTCSLSFGVNEPPKEQDLEIQELQGLNISVKGPFSRGVVL